MPEEAEQVPGSVPKRWYTIKDAAGYLAVSEQTIYRWMREGAISYHKIGDSTRFLREDLDGVVDKHVSYKEASVVVERCQRCGHAELVDGRILSTGQIYFAPKKTKFFTFRTGSVGTSARVCPRCGYVNLYADVEKLKKLTLKKAKPEEPEEEQ
jgi:excisionase family DNA binding protein